MKLHDALKNDDCIGQKVTADIPAGLEWVDYPDNYEGGVISESGVEAHEPNNGYRDVYVEGGLLGFCQGEVCEIKAFDEDSATVTLMNNGPKRSLATSGDNATVFTIPYGWYAAYFGTGWDVVIEGSLKQHISDARLKITTLVDGYAARHGTEKAFDKLCLDLASYYRDEELFDFAYDIKYSGYDIISTITLRDGELSLADDCEVWCGSVQVEMHYNWLASSQQPQAENSENPPVIDTIRAGRAKALQKQYGVSFTNNREARRPAKRESQESTAKDSVIAKIREGKAALPPRKPKHKKDGPEL